MVTRNMYENNNNNNTTHCTLYMYMYNIIIQYIMCPIYYVSKF